MWSILLKFRGRLGLGGDVNGRRLEMAEARARLIMETALFIPCHLRILDALNIGRGSINL